MQGYFKKATKNITPLNKWKRCLKFIGLVDYYCDMWETNSHTLEPLTKLTSNKVIFKWTEVEHINNLLADTDINELFKIHTNDICFLLRVVIIQEEKPIGFYSRKLTGPQK